VKAGGRLGEQAGDPQEERMEHITTLTMNPAVDVTTSVVDVVADRKLRCSAALRDPGGGGINVARVVNLLGGRALALWTRGGPTGAVLADLLVREAVEHRELAIRGDVRESFTVMEERTGSQFRFVLPGPTLHADECERIAACVQAMRPAPSYLVLSGSLPPGVPEDFYAQLARRAPPGTRVVVDTSGEALRALRGAGVFLLKPNLRELRELSGEELESDRSIGRAAQKLIDERTTEAVLVSMGARGARIISRDHDVHLAAPPVVPVSRVGAGDSTVGGLLYALSSGRDLVSAARFGVAAGAAAVLTPGTALCTRADTERLFAESKQDALQFA